MRIFHGNRVEGIVMMAAGVAVVVVSVVGGCDGGHPARPPGTATTWRAPTGPTEPMDPRPADPWAPGTDLPTWDRVEAIERWPVFNPHEPDWDQATTDRAWAVRAAAALAIGRVGNAALTPRLTALLDDPVAVVRTAAAWALLRLGGPGAKAGIERIMTVWPEPYGDSLRSQGELPAITLPYSVLNSPIGRRRRWFAKLDTDRWSAAPFPRQAVRPVVSLEHAQWDADASVAVAMRLTNPSAHPADTLALEPVSRGSPPALTAVGRWGELHPARFSHRPWMQRTAGFKLPQHKPFTGPVTLTLAPGQTRTRRFTVGPNTDTHRRHPHDPGLTPGVYMLDPIPGLGPMLVRIRRSAEMQQSIPGLLAKLPGGSTGQAIPQPARRGRSRVPGKLPGRRAVRRLGELRAPDAVKPLIALLPSHTRDPLGFPLANALGRIGDPAAVAVLLTHPHLSNGSDVVGSTAPSLRALGPAALPQLEVPLLAWRARLAHGDLDTLLIALEALGPHGSAAGGRARLALIDHLAGLSDKQLDAQGKPDGLKPRYLLDTALDTIADTQPDAAADVLWRMRGSRTFQGSGGVRGRLPLDALLGLWRRLPGPSGHDDAATAHARAELVSELMQRDPSAVLATPRSVRTVAQAESMLARLGWVHDRALRVKAAAVLEPWMKHGIRPSARTAYADLLMKLGRWAEARKQVDRALRDTDARPAQNMGQPRYHLLQLRAELSLCRQPPDRASASADLDAAAALLKDHPHAGDPWHGMVDLKEYAKNLPNVAGLSVRPVSSSDRAPRPTQRVSGTWTARRGPMWGLKLLDLTTGRRASIGPVPSGVAAFALLDHERAVVVRPSPGWDVGVYRFGEREPVWERALGVKPSEPAYLTATEACITLRGGDGVVRGLDPATGATRWRFDPGGKPTYPRWPAGQQPMIRQADGLVLVPDKPWGAGRLTALDAADGTGRWARDLPTRADALVVAGGGGVVIADRHGRVVALSLDDGSTRWRHDIPNKFKRTTLPTRLTLDPGRGVVYTTSPDHIEALDLVTGRPRWQIRPPDTMSGPLALRPSDAGVWLIRNLGDTYVRVALLDRDTGQTIFAAPSPTGYGDQGSSGLAVAHGSTLDLQFGPWGERWTYHPPKPAPHAESATDTAP